MVPSSQVPVSSAEAVANGVVKEKMSPRAPAKCNPNLSPDKLSIRGVVSELLACVNPEKPMVSLGVRDASSYKCFSEGRPFSRSLVKSVESGRFDCYTHSFGFLMQKLN